MLSNGAELSGEPLERRLEKLIMFRKFLQVVERRGPSRRAITALLEGGARDKTFWTDRELVDGLARHLQEPQISTTVVEDPEHHALAVVITDRSFGYDKHHRLDLDFVTTGEFRTLAAAYVDIRELMMGPVVIRTTGHSESSADVEVATDGEGGAEAAAGEEVAAPVAAKPASKDKDADLSLIHI